MQSRKKENGFILALRSLLTGVVLAPVDALVGFVKGGYDFFKSWYDSNKPEPGSNKPKSRSPLAYFYNFRSKEGDIQGKRYTAMTGLGRIGALVVTGVCIAGFIVTLPIPIPGVTPLAAITFGSIAKAAGITIGWSIVGRAAGALLGSLVDFFVVRINANNVINAAKEANNNAKKEIPVPEKLSTSRIACTLTKTLGATVAFGESALRVKAFFKENKNNAPQFNASISPPSNPDESIATATVYNSMSVNNPLLGSKIRKYS